MTKENQTDINEAALVKSFQNEMEDVLASKLNVDAIIGLAIATSFLRNDWDNQTSIDELDDDALSDIAEMAKDYCDWVRLPNVTITQTDVKTAIWGDNED